MGIGRIQIMSNVMFVLTVDFILHRKMLMVVLTKNMYFMFLFLFCMVYHRWLDTAIRMENNSGYSKWLVLQGTFYIAEFAILFKETNI